jgi:hypothetical protein
MIVIRKADAAKMTSAEKKELLISRSLLFLIFKSNPASSTIIMSPTTPNASTNGSGMGMLYAYESAICLAPIPANNSSNTDGTRMYLLRIENKYERITMPHIIMSSNSVLIEFISSITFKSSYCFLQPLTYLQQKKSNKACQNLLAKR